MFDYRIKPGEVLEAYRRTGLTPRRGTTLNVSHGCACAIGALWLDQTGERGLYGPGGRREGEPIECALYRRGFMLGFDADDAAQYRGAPAVLLEGFRDGEAVARAVFVEARGVVS